MNLRRIITTRPGIRLILVLQIVSLLLFPAASFSPNTQEWWLPVLLAIMVVVADVEIIIRRSESTWPWYLMSFAQGFNLISRLMLLWAHATLPVDGVMLVNTPYIALTFASMVISICILIYTEWPEVRSGLLRPLTSK